jgi:hypothetical protein
MKKPIEAVVKVIGYCRVTTKEMTDPIDCKQAQEEEIVRAADILNMKIEAMFTDDWASKPTHEFLGEALEYCNRYEEIRYLLITEPDRISRNMRVFDDWQMKFKSIGVETKFVHIEDNDRTQHLSCMSAEVDDICYRASITNAKDLDEPTQDFLEMVTQLIANLPKEQLSARIEHGLMAKSYKGFNVGS